MANPLAVLYARLTQRYLGRTITRMVREDWHNPIWWILGGIIVGHLTDWSTLFALIPGIALGHLFWGGGRLGARK